MDVVEGMQIGHALEKGEKRGVRDILGGGQRHFGKQRSPREKPGRFRLYLADLLGEEQDVGQADVVLGQVVAQAAEGHVLHDQLHDLLSWRRRRRKAACEPRVERGTTQRHPKPQPSARKGIPPQY